MSEDKGAKKRAVSDLNAIEALRKVPAFVRIAQRQLEELDKRRERILHDTSLGIEELYEERLLYLGAKEASEMLTGDEASCRRIIDSEPQSE